MKIIYSALVALLVLASAAHAYPQFQLSRDATCTSCHLSPSGGSLLNEMGLTTAEAISHKGTDPAFMYGKIPTPSWLVLGGDLRGSAGFVKTPENALVAFPMQADLAGAAFFGKGFSLQATVGYRPPNDERGAASSIWSREHYLMWQQNPGEPNGVYVRAGRFMPVLGLRLAEHPVYTRRYGGTALYAETYGLAVAYIDPKIEAHVTGFIKDPLIDTVEHYSGGAAYVECRLTDKLAIGAEGMAEIGKDDKRYRGGIIGKAYIEPADLLIQGEVQFVNQVVDSIDGRGAPKQIVGYLMLTRMLNDFLMLDVGFGHFDPNLRIGQNERTGFDLNLHYFTTSHIELVLNTRYESIGLGKGGEPGAYALMQLHYRL